ncbi:MAG: GNAT family acetyltransferase [Desulfobacter sp.]|nr:GNAT family acetyltransferase [Desulfobacter sp.]
MQDLIISPYTQKDHDPVIFLWDQCHLIVPWNDPNKDIQRKLQECPDQFFLARQHDLVIGSCMAGYDDHRGWFYYLGVLPKFRHQGVAGQLIAHGETLLTRLGCSKINLMVRQSNTEVIQFYKKNGYGQDPVMVMNKRLESDIKIQVSPPPL